MSSAQHPTGNDWCPLCLLSHPSTFGKCDKRQRHALRSCLLSLRSTHVTWKCTHRVLIRPRRYNRLLNLIAPSLAYPRHHPSATGRGLTSSMNLCARSAGILHCRPLVQPGPALPRHPHGQQHRQPMFHPLPHRPEQPLRRGHCHHKRRRHGRIDLTGGIGSTFRHRSICRVFVAKGRGLDREENPVAGRNEVLSREILEVSIFSYLDMCMS